MKIITAGQLNRGLYSENQTVKWDSVMRYYFNLLHIYVRDFKVMSAFENLFEAMTFF